MNLGVCHGILGQRPCKSVNHIVLSEIGSGEELQVHSGLSYQELGNRLVNVNLYDNAFVLRVNPQFGNEVIVVVGEFHLHAAVRMVDGPVGHHAEDVPLLGGVHQPDASSGGDTLASLDDLQACELLVVEAAVVNIVINQNVCTSVLKVVEVVHL